MWNHIFYIQQIPQKLHIKQISDSYSYIYFYRKYDIFFSSKNVYFLLSHYHYQRRKNMFEKNKPPALTQKSSSKTEKFVNLIFLLLLTLLLCIVWLLHIIIPNKKSSFKCEKVFFIINILFQISQLTYTFFPVKNSWHQEYRGKSILISL